MKRVKHLFATSIIALALLALSMSVTMAAGPLGTAFSYQGRLTDGGNPANGSYDLQFKLFDAASGGAQIGITQTKDNVSVSGGLFVVTLDFGASAFNGQARYLEIAVRAGSSTGAYTTLAPRQQLNPSPYALFSSAPWGTNGSNINYMQGKVGIGTTTPTSQLEIAAQDGLAITGYQPFLTLRDANAGNARAIIQDVNGAMNFVPNSFIGGSNTAMLLGNNGYLGIGTNIPLSRLTVVEPGAPQPTAYFTDTGLGIGTLSGTFPLALRQNAPESATPGLAVFETSNGALGGLGANSGTFVVSAASGKALGFNVNNTTRAITIGSDGNVGIGTNIIGARLAVRGNNTGDNVAFRVEDVNGSPVMSVFNNGTVGIGKKGPGNSQGACWTLSVNMWFLSDCNSAAEYVPTIDSGSGFPETGDVVSIAPQDTNPYNDEHGPFVVTKSPKPCDENLLGYIVDPKSGASGKKLNDHYLPLAIFGYFPGKVTTENGIIQRGDPLTSSNKPGYAMKATGACRIIGYALEDANVEGTIQVFANTGETAVAEVASLRERVQKQDARIAELEQQVAAMQNAQAAQLTEMKQQMAELKKQIERVQPPSATGTNVVQGAVP